MTRDEAILNAIEALGSSDAVNSDDGMVVTLTDRPELRLEERGATGLRLVAVPPGVAVGHAVRLLEANLYGVETGGARWAMVEGTPVLMRDVDCAALEPEAFDAILTELVMHAGYWTAGPGADVLDREGDPGELSPLHAGDEVLIRI